MSFTAINMFSVVVGILPPLVWLWFWLKEDTLHPEPRTRIILAFLAGMIAVMMVLPFQIIADQYFPRESLALYTVWALIEEVMKLGAAYVVAFRSRVFDEPIDAPIYLITVALGFAALENVLFLLSFGEGVVLTNLILSNTRFIGATLLHLLSSSIIGIALALAYYKPFASRILWTTVGLVLAIALHTEFNYLIMNNDSATTLTIFVSVWVLLIIILLFFERVKRLTIEHYETT